MFELIVQNLGTVVIGCIVIGIVTAIIVKIVLDKRKGKCASCDCGCRGCSSTSKCQTKP